MIKPTGTEANSATGDPTQGSNQSDSSNSTGPEALASADPLTQEGGQGDLAPQNQVAAADGIGGGGLPGGEIGGGAELAGGDVGAAPMAGGGGGDGGGGAMDVATVA